MSREYELKELIETRTMIVGEKYKATAQIDFEPTEEWERSVMTRYEEVIKKVNIPKRYENVYFDDIDWHTTKQELAARKYLDTMRESQSGMIITGREGNGKTMFGVCIAKRAIMLGMTSLFVSEADIMNIWQGGNQNITDEDRHFLHKTVTVDVLVIDDCGYGKYSSDFVKSKLFLLHNTRYNGVLKTVLTTNRAINELFSLYDADDNSNRIKARLLNTCEHFMMTGKSRRMA